MAVSIHRVFWIGAVLSAMALFVALLLPKQEEDLSVHRTDKDALTVS
jgi:hypothetical protein